jgi:drug/metabolite transporter (DMT)-like permease
MRNNHQLPYVALGVGILSLSFSAMFVRWANSPGTVTGFYRLFLSTLILTPFFLQRQHDQGPIPIKLLIFPILAGIFTSGDFSLWNSSLAFTTAANATLLGNTAPLWVALGAWLIFHERLNRFFWLGLIFALTGAVLIMGSDFILHPRLGIGDLMASSAAIFYASYMLSTQKGRQHIDPFRYTWLVGISASVSMFFINLILGHKLVGYDSQTWLVFFATAIISQTIGYISISYALGHLPAHVVSPTMVGQPIMTTLLAIPLLGEIPNLIQVLGGLVALTGIYIVNQSHNSAEPKIPNG